MPLDNTPALFLQSRIATVNESRSRLERIESLIDEHSRKSHAARRRMRECEIALSVAKENESRDVVAALISDTQIPAKSVADYTAEFEDTLTDFENTGRLLKNLETEMEAATRALRFAEIDRDRALEAALKTHPAVVALCDRQRQLEAEAASVTEALRVISKRFGIPDGYNFQRFNYDGQHVDRTLANMWAKAIDEFATNPETTLPEIT
jgi:predicted O-linked N-acetylglucosamine transferase (SPINDLY family)